MQIAQSPTKFKYILAILVSAMLMVGTETVALTLEYPDNASKALPMLFITSIGGILTAFYYYQRAKKEDQ